MADPFSRALALERSGRIAEAKAGYGALLDQDPFHVEANHRLGLLLSAAGADEAALALVRMAAERAPDRWDILSNLGNALLKAERWEEAVKAYRHALELRPADPDLILNLAQGLLRLGNARAQEGRLAEAETPLAEALALAPDRSAIAASLGSVLLDLGRTDEAAARLDDALAREPDHVIAHWNRAHARLRSGDWVAGWEDFRWRHRRLGAIAPPPIPEWDGLSLPTGTLLVWPEQGMGDALHFARFLPWAREKVAKLVLAAHPPLLPLLRASFSDIEGIAMGGTLPKASAQIALLDLAHLFGARPDHLPPLPYLSPDPARLAHWKDRLAGPAPKIGFAWKGNPHHPADARRSLALADLAPILALPEIRFFALQMDRIEPLPPGIADLAPALCDFGETAAIVANLDAVITPDTALAHLTGALGRPGHLLLPLAGDWRWGENSRETPWYPSLVLHRQERAGDWTAPIQRLISVLRNVGRRGP